MLTCENRLSEAPPAGPAPAAGGAAVAPNPPLAAPKTLPLSAAAGAAAPKPLPNPAPVFDVEEKVNSEAEPNPEVSAGLSVVGAAKEKVDGEVAPNPEGGCVGAAKVLPNPVEEGGAAEDPNPPLGAAKLKESAAAGAPKPTWSERFRMNKEAMDSAFTRDEGNHCQVDRTLHYFYSILLYLLAPFYLFYCVALLEEPGT